MAVEAPPPTLLAALPEAGAAAADPAASATALGPLVRASLAEDWRHQNSGEGALGRLADLAELHLARLGDEIPEVGGEDDGSRGNEAACSACVKLARNLCAGSPSVQEFWWRRGMVQKLAARVRADLTIQGGSRHVAWREAVPTLVANLVAGNADLRVCVLDALFPHDIAALCALCWKRPEHAFILAQNLFASGSGSALHVRRLVETEDGHCLLFLLLSFLRGREDERENELSARTLEWASVFFHGLWSAGGFASAYRGVSRLGAARLHSFLAAAAGVGAAGGPGGEAWARPPLSIGFWRLMESLCGREEARCLLWHTIHGLLAGPGGGDESGPRAASRELARRLLGDDDFVGLAASEMIGALSRLATEWNLDWSPPPASAEALAALGAQPDEVDLPRLAGLCEEAEPAGAAPEPPGEEEAPTEGPEPGGGSVGSAAQTRRLFGELLQAAVELAAVPRAPGAQLPVRLVGAYLTGNVAFMDALHRLRFGAAGAEAPRRTESSPRAAEAARACQLVDQLRLCGNVLYEQPHAQDFLRLTGGLRVILSHCYSDHELPLLREAGIFAVRNATQLNATNQRLAKQILAEKRAAAGGEQLVDDFELGCG